MGGLKHIFYRILPIVTLVCFISLGILHLFPDSNRNLTYLETQYINKTTGEIYTNPTEEQIDESYKMYNYDFPTYLNNIDQDILKRSVTKTFNLNAYTNIANGFDAIWRDGYDFGDVSKTILNAIILVIDTLILSVNIALVPIRIISGILLTGMSIVGININNGTIITPFLTFIVDNLSIPLINALYATQDADNLPGSSWVLKTQMNAKYYKKTVTGIINGELNYHYTDFDIEVSFHTEKRVAGQYARYGGIYTTYGSENGTIHFKIYYRALSQGGGEDKLIYDNGYVEGITTEDRTITFTQWEVENVSSEEIQEALYFLNANASQIIPTNMTAESYIVYDRKKLAFC